MKAKIREAPARAVTMELYWLEIWEIGWVKFLDSVRKEAIIPTVMVWKPVSPKLGILAMAR